MRKKELQLLAVLALIAGVIIALSIWGGKTDEARDVQVGSESARRRERDETVVPAQRTVPVPSDQLGEIFDFLASRGERVAAPLEVPPGRSIDDKLAETAPEDIPLEKPERVEVKEADRPEETVIYVVRQGDTLSGISQRYYGTSGRWRDILEANKNQFSAPEKLRAGMSIVIPGVRETARKAEEEEPERRELQLSVSSHASEGGREYTVQRGDTLWSIAAEHYGDGARYRRLMEANEDKITDRDALAAGMVIFIPE